MERTRPDFAGHMVFFTDAIHIRVTPLNLWPVLTPPLTDSMSKSHVHPAGSE